MISCQDWRDAADREVEDLLTAEAGRWLSDFGWDVSESWRTLAAARRAGSVPGFVARDDRQRACGWTCFVLHRGALQVATFVAESPDVIDALLTGILASPEADNADIQTFFVPHTASRLADSLSAAGFATTPYHYLSRSLPGDADSPVEAPICRPWTPADFDATLTLCGRAYRSTSDDRPFAPHGTEPEWRDYVYGLVRGTGCGRLMRPASLVVQDPGGDGLIGCILSTDLGPHTAHVAQVMVDPRVEGRGIGRTLLAGASAAARQNGATSQTLLVSARNGRARDLYQRWSFRERGVFLSAVNRQPRRLTSVAPVTGGASTRR